MTIRIDNGSLEDAITAMADEWIRDNADLITSAVAAAAPRGETGALQASHRSRRTGRRTFEIVAEAKHAVFVHFGRGPVRPIAPGGFVTWPGSGVRHPAPPRGFLRFEVGGRTVFAREVGPVAPNPWMIRALRKLGFEVREVA